MNQRLKQMGSGSSVSGKFGGKERASLEAKWVRTSHRENCLFILEGGDEWVCVCAWVWLHVYMRVTQPMRNSNSGSTQFTGSNPTIGEGGAPSWQWRWKKGSANWVSVTHFHSPQLFFLAVFLRVHNLPAFSSCLHRHLFLFFGGGGGGVWHAFIF